MPRQTQQPLECGSDAHIVLLSKPLSFNTRRLGSRAAARRLQPAQLPRRRSRGQRLATARRTRPLRPHLHPQKPEKSRNLRWSPRSQALHCSRNTEVDLDCSMGALSLPVGVCAAVPGRNDRLVGDLLGQSRRIQKAPGLTPGRKLGMTSLTMPGAIRATACAGNTTS